MPEYGFLWPVYSRMRTECSKSAAEHDILQQAITDVSEIIYKKKMITTML